MSNQDILEIDNESNDENFWKKYSYGSPGYVEHESIFAVYGSTKMTFQKSESFIENESIDNNPQFNSFLDNFDNYSRDNYNNQHYENKQEVDCGDQQSVSQIEWKQEQSYQLPQNQQFSEAHFESENPEQLFHLNPQLQSEIILTQEVDNVPALSDSVQSLDENNQDITVIEEQFQFDPSHSIIGEKEEIPPKQNENEVHALHSVKKRKKKLNSMQKNACEETKNLLNYVMPYLEKNMKMRWEQINSFKSKGNHNSMVFLNALAEEVDGLEPQEKAKFYNEYDNFFKIDLRIIALNQIKLDTTFLLLKYGDSFINVIKNPNRFKSIKKAKNPHSVPSSQARSRRYSNR